MGTYRRTLASLAVGGLSLAVVLAAGAQLYSAWQGNALGATETRTPRERAYAVQVAPLVEQTVTPVITGYGHLASGRTLELRAAVAGPLLALSGNFRDGGVVAEGEVLAEIDPARLASALALAEADVAEAEAAVSEAQSALELAKLEAEAAQAQLDLRAQAVARQEGLRERGVATDSDVETAVLARSAAEQTLVNRRQVVGADEARVASAEIALERERINLEDARRALGDASLRAPFAGVISAVSAVPGRLVSVNEQLGTLIDPATMEVAFRVTNTQYARLLNDQGALRQVDVTLVAQSGRSIVELPAKLDRASAEVGDGQVGRLVYARLADPDPKLVQPGDFVTVKVPERPLSGVAVIPATAATADGRILVLGEGNRLEEFQVTLLRQQGDDLIVGDAPFGRDLVLARALQLGPGIQVEPVRLAAAAAETAAETSAPETPAEPETIALDDTRRAAIIAFINASTQMSPDNRAKWLEELSRPEVPLATVEKFEAKMAEGQ